MNRRVFLQTGLASLASTKFFLNHKYKKKLCYNTLACPDWSLDEVLKNARKYGYTAVEIRGIKEDIDILNSPEFAPERIGTVRAMAQKYGVKILNLNSSVVLHEYEATKRQHNIDIAKSYIDLAVKLDCPFVRVFPDKFPKEKSKDFTLKTIRETYEVLIDYCQGTNVKVLLDAHGDLVWSEDIKALLESVDRTHSGIIWDFFNMHLKTNESPTEMYGALKEYIEIVQIKDGFFKPNQKFEYTLTGKGEVPIQEIIQLLETDNYQGFISFEWEKRWHPELPNPAIALPDFVSKLKKL